MAGLDKFWRNKLLMIKTEVTSGTDAVPVAATDAIQASNVSLTIEADEQTRETEKSYFEVAQTSYTNKRVSLSFDVEVVGGGAADTPPAIAPVLLMCQYTETIVASTSVTYTPSSGNSTSSTVYLNIDGILYKTTYAKGSINYNFAIGDVPRATVTLTGLYLTPTDVALVNGNYSAFRVPIKCTKDNSTMSIHGTLVDGVSLSYDQGNENSLKESTETIAIANTNRQGSCEVTCWANPLATFNPFTLWEGETKGVVYWENGLVAGDIIRLTMPAAQIGTVQPADTSDGVSGYTVPVLPFSDSSGDNEHSLIFT